MKNKELNTSEYQTLLNRIEDESLLKAIALAHYNGNWVYLRDEDGQIQAFEDEEMECELLPIDGDEERENYMVLTDEEADEKAKQYISDSLWAFNASFLSDETGIDKSVFDAIHANDKCEGNNDAILSCIDDLESFVESAISSDGRGHFISSYDGNENEQRVNGITYFIYRIN